MVLASRSVICVSDLRCGYRLTFNTEPSTAVWERPNFFESSAITKSLDRCLDSSGLTADAIDVYDFYSCFPIVPKLACHHLGLSITKPQKPITVLGGLTSFGGAGNNYSMHAITEIVRRLRKGSERNALILANGGFLSYQHAICLSVQPRRTPYPDSRRFESGPSEPIPPIDAEAEGKAQIEVRHTVISIAYNGLTLTAQTYTVEFARDGNPKMAYIVGRLLGNNHRFLANHGDETTLKALSSTSEEPIGRVGMVTPESVGKKGRNLFYLDGSSRL